MVNINLQNDKKVEETQSQSIQKYPDYISGQTSSDSQGETNISEVQQIKYQVQNVVYQFDSDYQFDQQNEADIEILLQQIGYKIEKFLSEGGQARVYIVRQINTNKKYAMKVFFQNQIQNGKQEYEICQRFEKTIYTKEIKEFIIHTNFSFLISEYYDQDLSDEIEDIKHYKGANFTFQKLLLMIFNIIDGYSFLRIYNIIHLDIKTSNILKNETTAIYIISDHGCSLIYKPNQLVNYNQRCFTEKYAPEELKKGTKEIGPKTDIYSLGKTFQEIFEQLKEFIVGDSFSFAKQFIQIIHEKMIQTSIDKRVDIQELHRLFFEVIKDEKYKEFLKEYIKYIKDFSELTHYDENKNIPYYSSINVHYLKVQIDISQFLGFSKQEIAQKLYNLGNFYIQIQDYTNGFKYANESLLIRKELGNTREIALSTLDESYQLAQSLNPPDYYLLSSNLYYMAGYYYNNNDKIKSLEFSQKSLLLRKQHMQPDNILIAHSLQQYALILEQDESLQYFYEALEIINLSYPGKHELKIKILINMGVFMSSALRRFDDSQVFSFQALQMCEEIFQDTSFDIILLYNNIAHNYNHLNNPQTAFIYILKSLQLARSIQNIDPLYMDTYYDTLWESIFLMEKQKQS
ncbi:kinase domain protein (macronuclear) [Tetrahymena thermophila SB210]|uniref:Cyclin-dependent kinase 2 homolog n=1 Tax=Tetrahymena thermophila (strain SB210) TaxID=312017 RepID=Q23BT1_TETTS|nr:kinase domain protein [Tetrahymena thermophila SB210]EAR94037.2 kinase domain protein [Tetrahymena thermophila SB210]|eukprot:XP_001014282.2 kinase domain protein [Tetrahymena thermophila SB210]